MKPIYVRVCCTVTPSEGVTRVELDEHFYELADAFYELSDIQDQSLEADWDRMRMFFDMTLNVEEEIDAVAEAYNYARSAIHAAGGHTPGWEDAVKVKFETHRATTAEEMCLT